jgi:hydrogenase nickel incorporation protein HypA/HybF
MSVARSIVRIAEDVSADNGDAEVLAVRLAVGAFDHLDDDALRFAFGIAGEGTACDGATLEIERRPFAGRCGSCDGRFESREIVASCPECGASKLEWDGREGTEVLTVDVAAP